MREEERNVKGGHRCFMGERYHVEQAKFGGAIEACRQSDMKKKYGRHPSRRMAILQTLGRAEKEARMA